MVLLFFFSGILNVTIIISIPINIIARQIKIVKHLLYVIILLLHTGVNFVPTFLTKGRIDSAIFEVDLPIAKTIASRKRMYQGVHPPASSSR